MARFSRRRIGDNPIRHAVRFASLALSAAVLTGCSTGSSTSTTSAGAPAETNTRVNTDASTYVIDRDDIREMGYRLDWQAIIGPGRLNGMKMVSLEGDALYGLDRRNVLTRIRTSDGAQMWTTPVGTPLEAVQGINAVAATDRVYITAGGQLYEVEAANGAAAGRQKLSKIASTAPQQVGDNFVYGSTNGQMIWHAYQIAFQFRAYQVAQSIKVQPRLYNDLAVVVGNDGEVMVLDVDAGRQLWSKRLLDPVVAPPAIDQMAVYVTSEDQHVYAFDVSSGRQLWRRLFEVPLVDAPTVIENDLYVHVPNAGLHCFEAVPFNKPAGELKWVCPDVSGTVIAQRGDRLITWNADNKVLAVVDQRTGSKRHDVELSDVLDIVTNGLMDPDIYVVSHDGRAQRLVMRP
ncbi:MAG: PQQ-binding-like beta-propeller repeat protein [Planctomycetota bacterium]